MKIKLTASDYDGTFCQTSFITKRNKAAAIQYRKKGGLFGFVTGRGSDFYEHMKERNIPFDFLILDNGAHITDQNGKPLYESFLSVEAYQTLEREMKNIPDVLKYDRYSENCDRHLYFALFPTPKRTFETAAMLNEKYADILSAYANGRCLNVMTAGEGKKNGIKNILEIYSLTPDQAAVVGDDYNDLEMIAQYKGYAVINARKEVKEVAGHRVLSVASLLHKLIRD